jgi:hypothetical protein
VGAGLLAALAAGFGSGALTGRSRITPAQAQTCGAQGDPCVPNGCCAGLTCSAEATCQPDPNAPICAYEGESCAKRPCCDGLLCTEDGSAICYVPAPAPTCGNPWEPCIDGVCCDGSVCGDDGICYELPTETGQCGYQGEACTNGCCDGFACGNDGICYQIVVDNTQCGYQGDPCDFVCCDGFACGEDGLCYQLEDTSGGGNARCQNEGESCANRDCCEGLACSGDQVCVAGGGGGSCAAEGQACDAGCCDGLTCGGAGVCESAVYCAFEGEYCRYLDCCDGLACSEDFACVPSTQAGGNNGGGNNSGGNDSGGDNNSTDSTAPRPARTPKPDKTPAAPAPQPQTTRPNSGGAAATPRAGQAQPERPARQNTFKGEPVFSTAVPADALPEADAYALLAQVATIEPGLTVDFAKEAVAGYPGLAIDYVIEGSEQLVGGGEVQAYRSKTPGAAELIDAGQSVTLAPGDAAVRKIEDGWKVSNTGTTPLRILHIVVNENGAPTPPPGWSWSEFAFGSPVVEGPLGIMNLAVQRGPVDPDETVGTAAKGSSQAVVQDLAARGARVAPLVPEPDGFLRNASSKPTTVYTVTLSPANG